MGYKQLPKSDPWVLVPAHERALIQRLQKEHKNLDDRTITKAIFVGVQTNSNKIYHLERIGKDKYLYQVEKDQKIEVDVEDDIMRPLVSGTEAKRYTSPLNEKHVLFPYKVTQDSYSLYSQAEMQSLFPKAWAFFKSVEDELRKRENGKIDDDNKWWGWVYLKNIDKQHLPKLMVAQTVPDMRVSPDEKGEYCLDNVRVNGIIPANQSDFDFLLGILNSQIVNWVFKRIAKPKEGGFFEANKQFIAPLPVPKATKEQKKDVGDRAKALQELHTKRRDKLEALEKRFGACPVKKRKDDWLFPQIGNMNHWKAEAPDDLSERDKTKWAKEQRILKIEERLEGIDARLNPAAQLAASFKDGELSFAIDGVPVIDKVFINDEAHLHVQVQQVFMRKAYGILRNHKSLGKSVSHRTQMIVSTHSSHIAHECEFSCLRYFRRKPSDAKGEAPTSTVVNLSDVFGKDNDTARFVTRYLKAAHCDLFFADAAILIEGAAERMLLPHFIKKHFPTLDHRYLTILEVGGSHAHSFKPLIEDLALTTLIITDIDTRSVQITSNPTLKEWLPRKEKLEDLLKASADDKTFVNKEANFSIRVAYQNLVRIKLDPSSPAIDIAPNTFEDALLYANVEIFKALEGKRFGVS